MILRQNINVFEGFFKNYSNCDSKNMLPLLFMHSYINQKVFKHLNSLCSFFSFRTRRLRKPSNYLVINLVLCDMMMLHKMVIFIFNSFMGGPIAGPNCKYEIEVIILSGLCDSQFMSNDISSMQFKMQPITFRQGKIVFNISNIYDQEKKYM